MRNYASCNFRYVYRITNHWSYNRTTIYYHNIRCFFNGYNRVSNIRQNHRAFVHRKNYAYCNYSSFYKITNHRDHNNRTKHNEIVHSRNDSSGYSYLYRTINNRFYDRIYHSIIIKYVYGIANNTFYYKTTVYDYHNICRDYSGNDRVTDNVTNHRHNFHSRYNASTNYGYIYRIANYRFYNKTSVYRHNDDNADNNNTNHHSIVYSRNNASCNYGFIYRITNHRNYDKIYRITNYSPYHRSAIYHSNNFWCNHDGDNGVANNSTNHNRIVYPRDNTSWNYSYIYRSTNRLHYRTTVYYHNIIYWDYDGDNRFGNYRSIV
uniref:Uncharacterized protein n=1 Tax=Branchiostoma floridae TaxID=7739 RepID=C3YSI3_BRAFL|eukprot:XP_002600672.1 hypothetical protein BRAFLDRAFT_67732 [Branchiostoma floridae]